MSLTASAASFRNNEKSLNLGSVKWSSDITKVIENDEKDFHMSNLDASLQSLQFRQLVCNDSFCNEPNPSGPLDSTNHSSHDSHNANLGGAMTARVPNHIFGNSLKTTQSNLKMSWGVFFAKKSPPMGDLSGTSQDRPRFSPNKKVDSKIMTDSVTTSKDISDQSRVVQPNSVEHKEKSVEPQTHSDRSQPATSKVVDVPSSINKSFPIQSDQKETSGVILETVKFNANLEHPGEQLRSLSMPNNKTLTLQEFQSDAKQTEFLNTNLVDPTSSENDHHCGLNVSSNSINLPIENRKLASRQAKEMLHNNMQYSPIMPLKQGQEMDETEQMLLEGCFTNMKINYLQLEVIDPTQNNPDFELLRNSCDADTKPLLHPESRKLKNDRIFMRQQRLQRQKTLAKAKNKQNRALSNKHLLLSQSGTATTRLTDISSQMSCLNLSESTLSISSHDNCSDENVESEREASGYQEFPSADEVESTSELTRPQGCESPHQESKDIQYCEVLTQSESSNSIAKTELSCAVAPVKMVAQTEMKAKHQSRLHAEKAAKSQSCQIESDTGHNAVKIEVPELEHIQRFYQFNLKTDFTLDKNGAQIESEIQNLLMQYINTGFKSSRKPTLSAIFFEKHTNRITILLVFNQYSFERQKDYFINFRDDNMYKKQESLGDSTVEKSSMRVEEEIWVKHFLSFEMIAQIMSNECQPCFTQLSS